MNGKDHLADASGGAKVCLGVAAVLTSLLTVLPLIRAESRGAWRGGGGRTSGVDRFSHGSIRHADNHVFQRPAVGGREGGRFFDGHREGERWGGWGGAVVHAEREADFYHRHYWHDFGFGRRHAVLPFGCITVQLGGVPYYYGDGIYYQPVEGGYQEVYPPVGAAIPQPPEGAMAVYANGQTYYYAGGAYYALQPDGTYATVAPPIGVVVPELPPGAVQSWVRGAVAYQFNGVYYEPVFVNGVTQYETIMP